MHISGQRPAGPFDGAQGDTRPHNCHAELVEASGLMYSLVFLFFNGVHEIAALSLGYFASKVNGVAFLSTYKKQNNLLKTN
ncbi:hypothetical protein GCM10027049_05190 [Mucilaginibacter puniceus]